MPRVDADFAKRVYELVARIPRGRVATYGQLAALAGAAELPWQRVVNKQGGLAVGWPGSGRDGHKAALEADGIAVSDDYKVDVKSLLWNPDQVSLL
jgi:methylated-DNA-protein-cysteine methyltransferase-like protein